MSKSKIKTNDYVDSEIKMLSEDEKRRLILEYAKNRSIITKKQFFVIWTIIITLSLLIFASWIYLARQNIIAVTSSVKNVSLSDLNTSQRSNKTDGIVHQIKMMQNMNDGYVKGLSSENKKSDKLRDDLFKVISSSTKINNIISTTTLNSLDRTVSSSKQ